MGNERKTLQAVSVPQIGAHDLLTPCSSLLCASTDIPNAGLDAVPLYGAPYSPPKSPGIWRSDRGDSRGCVVVLLLVPVDVAMQNDGLCVQLSEHNFYTTLSACLPG